MDEKLEKLIGHYQHQIDWYDHWIDEIQKLHCSNDEKKCQMKDQTDRLAQNKLLLSALRAYRKPVGEDDLERQDRCADLMTLAEKMNVCDLVQENHRLHNTIRHMEADLTALRQMKGELK